MTITPKIKTVSLDLIGILGVLTVSQLLIQSAYLNGVREIPWLWAVGFGLVAIWVSRGPRGDGALKERVVPTVAVFSVLVLVPGLSTLDGFNGTPWQWVLLLKNNLLQIAGYLVGAETVLPELLKPAALHWICGGTSLVLFWGKGWKFRRAFFGSILLFGCIRWNQYVPEMESLLMNLGLVWCFSAALSGTAEETAPPRSGRNLGRFYTSLVLTGGILVGTLILTAVFPLDGVNRWVGSWMPGQEIYRNEYTQLRQIGFQLEDTQWHPLGHRLGGTVIPAKEPVMLVKSSRPGLHLRGAVKTTYTGQSWEADPINLRPQEIRPVPSGREPFVITVTPLDSQDRTVYTPLHTDRVTAGNRKILVGNGGVYRLGFQWFQEKGQKYHGEGYLIAAEAHSEEVLDPYLQLPQLSPAFRKSALKIAGSQGTDRDRMERLVQWLRANGHYRLEVGSPDPSRDFVEQFVLGSREGYCTYFASALAVMGRVAGIPTRYVEGYLLPDQTTGGQTYLVTSDRSHAWVEAYLAEEGWVVFEPTPASNLGGERVTGMGKEAEELSIFGGDPGESHPEKESAEEAASLVGLLPWGWAGFLGILLISGLRIFWVEEAWRRGVSGSCGDLWRLYSALSVLTLLKPTDHPFELPTEELLRAQAIFSFSAFASHDIIGDTNQLLYGKQSAGSAGFQVLLEELWQTYRNQKGILSYWVARYGTLSLFNSYTPLIGNREIRKDVHHGADQPHTATQS